ncbi:MAG: cupin domain-containing protein [Pseudomonadales bacterium]|nr:cupin domain-containing protein [Pseudomonadales bacterium]MCC6530753.1 cupin domain-containing protein [Pseudomonadales bacterium]MCP5333850.1 cupin domain-containing protein [Pseudomonadales bacterium]HQN42264.1 cupin domain-containing protein [Pseudomonadales bacterium]
MNRTRWIDAIPYVTKDGSTIRELMHPDVHGNQGQSLAEARLPPGGSTLLHRHLRSEEIYHVTEGAGLMQLGEQRLALTPGDTVAIPAGVPHALTNPGEVELVLLCLCVPPYSHEETELLVSPLQTAG